MHARKICVFGRIDSAPLTRLTKQCSTGSVIGGFVRLFDPRATFSSYLEDGALKLGLSRSAKGDVGADAADSLLLRLVAVIPLASQVSSQPQAGFRRNQCPNEQTALGLAFFIQLHVRCCPSRQTPIFLEIIIGR